MLPILVFVVVLFAPTIAAAQGDGGILQDYATNAWTERDGLPSGRIAAIAQTGDDYLWLGTNVGLVRFDGITFLQWRELSSLELPARSVWALCAATDDSLWVGFSSPGGVSRIKDGLVTNFDEADGLPDGAVNSLTEAHDGTIWVATHGGLFHFRNGRFERVGLEAGLADGAVTSTFEDSGGNLWISTTDGVFRRLRNAPQFERIVSASYWAHRVAEDESGAIWITDPRIGMRRLLDHPSDPAPNVLSDSGLAPEGNAASASGLGVQMLSGDQDVLWVATLGRGLWRRRTVGGKSTIDTLTIDRGLLSNSVRALLRDREGDLWVGTDNGLQQLSRKTVTGLTGLGLVRVVERGADESIWVGTTTGLLRFKDGQKVRYGSRKELPSPFVTALHADRSGTLWIATDSGVARFINERFVSVPLPRTPQLTRVYSITTDARGNLWLCDVNRGLFRWSGHTLTPFDVSPQLDHRSVSWVFGDAAQRVWVRTTSGELMVVNDDGSLGRVDSITSTTPPSPADSQATLWMGSPAGAERLIGNSLAIVGQGNGLPTATVTAVVPGGDGYVWLATPAGLVRVLETAFDAVQKEPNVRVGYSLYDVEDGMAGLPVRFANPSAVRASDGRIWFVTNNGLTIVDPATVLEDVSIPPVRIEGVIADARKLDLKAPLRLKPKTSTIEIDYSAVTFSSPKKVQYRYRLEGFDDDWREVGTRREALYTNLPPGQYRFRVAAANNEKGFSVNGATVDFVLLPTFYQTWWFLDALVLSVLLGLWATWRLRIRHLHHEFSLVLGERARVGREIHDTLLQCLVGVALQLDALSAAAGPGGFMKDTLAQTRREVEEYIRETRQTIWNLRSSKLDRSDLVAALRQTGEHATSGTPIRFTLSVTGQARRFETMLEQQLLRIGEQAVLNSVRHAHPSEVHLKLQYGDSAVRLRVSDNGTGFNTADLVSEDGKHYGLIGMQERADEVGGQLSVTTHPGGGTAVEIVIPVTSRK